MHDSGPHSEAAARAMDAADPLRTFRERFHIPAGPDGAPSIYLCGNSLGLQPRSLSGAMAQELEDWARLGVEGHFKQPDGWYAYHALLREPLARLVGALPHEVVAMNSLTVNLHLMLVSFYRPKGNRRRILIDGPCFPSDVYAVKSQLRCHNVPEAQGLLWLTSREGEHTTRTEDAIALIEREGDSIALVMLAGVNFVTGQFQDMEAITAAAQRKGCMIGWDLAHAAGNVPLRLHDWNADFAVWCSYKYLNSGPGAVAGCFVHERHTKLASAQARRALPRFEGWWGNDPETRFRMGPDFEPVASADAWQLSNPPILALLPVKESLAIFDEAGIENLRRRSIRLTAYLESLVKDMPRVRIITPKDPASRGAQLSLLCDGDGRAAHRRLTESGVICDFREPNVIRLAPTPLYNSFHDCWRAADALRVALGAAAR